jgi:hypothetical protein
MKLSQITEAGMPGRFAKSDDTKRAERNAKRRDQRSAERDAEKSKNDKLLDKYWRVFTDMAAQTYPDADPIEACFQKYRDFDMDKLNAAAKKHGYDDPMDYWDEMGDLPMEGKKKSPAGGPPCWKGKKIHPTKPTKMKGGKRVNNCIDAGTSESFDPSSEPSHQDELMDIYLQSGEEALADALGLTPEQLDQEINEIGFEHGLHADDDREEIIYKVIDDTISNADIDAYEETEMNTIDELRQLAGLNESYPMGMDADNNTNVSFNQTKKIGDATLNIHATAKDMAELQKVLQMAGLDPDGAEKHMPEPDSVQVVDVDPEPSPCGGDTRYSTDKTELIDMLKNKLANKLN